MLCRYTHGSALAILTTLMACGEPGTITVARPAQPIAAISSDSPTAMPTSQQQENQRPPAAENETSPMNVAPSMNDTPINGESHNESMGEPTTPDDEMTTSNNPSTPGTTMEPEQEPTPEEPALESCNFGYPPIPAERNDGGRANGRNSGEQEIRQVEQNGVYPVAHAEPEPPGYWSLQLPAGSARNGAFYGLDRLTMPDYNDSSPLFDRAGEWNGEERCYELPTGAQMLDQDEAYALWQRIVRTTLWYDIDETPGKRTVIGLRGAYPGTFTWHTNPPNQFNDTIVLLWKDDNGQAHVREFPVNTDTGRYNFGSNNSSSLKPNRHYPYTNAWHRGYNALRMGLPSYPVQDDTNKNGHWDDDRNGWLDGGPRDRERLGNAHNIHMASSDEAWNEFPINRWSAGCQVIPGQANWNEFISNAWTWVNDSVDYYLIDARDVDARVWEPCNGPDGSHDCPHEIRVFPYEHQGDTGQAADFYYDIYNCSSANESGAEEVFIVNIRETGTLRLQLVVNDPELVDPDVHILTGDDSRACLGRDHQDLQQTVTPGRYVIVVDTWTNDSGVSLAGAYELYGEFVPQ